jgi:hypothetical protein
VTDRELYRSLAGELEWKAISLPLSERKMLRGPRLLLLLLLPSSESDSMGRLELWSGLEEYEVSRRRNVGGFGGEATVNSVGQVSFLRPGSSSTKWPQVQIISCICRLFGPILAKATSLKGSGNSALN